MNLNHLKKPSPEELVDKGLLVMYNINQKFLAVFNSDVHILTPQRNDNAIPGHAVGRPYLKLAIHEWSWGRRVFGVYIFDASNFIILEKHMFTPREWEDIEAEKDEIIKEIEANKREARFFYGQQNK